MIKLHKYKGYTIMICHKQKSTEKNSEADNYRNEKYGYFFFIFDSKKEIVDRTFDIQDAAKALDYAQKSIDFALQYRHLI